MSLFRRKLALRASTAAVTMMSHILVTVAPAFAQDSDDSPLGEMRPIEEYSRVGGGSLSSAGDRDIEAGRMLSHAGFARGNYNYRINSVGVNLVGTGLRDCSDSLLPSTCYAAGFLQYSLYYNGPYEVTNHMGTSYRAKLFEGVVEHARALAAERYFSNPISSTDGDLLSEYVRTELQGRPMDGAFSPRVWDADGFDFSQLEDVQVVLNYHYWSR